MPTRNSGKYLQNLSHFCEAANKEWGITHYDAAEAGIRRSFDLAPEQKKH